MASSVKDERAAGTLYPAASYAACDVLSLDAVVKKGKLAVTVGLRGSQKQFVNTYLSLNTKGGPQSGPEFTVGTRGDVASVGPLGPTGIPAFGKLEGNGAASLAQGGRQVLFEVPVALLGGAKSIGVQAKTCGEGAVDIAPGKNYFDDRTFNGSVAYSYLIATAERVIKGRIVDQAGVSLVDQVKLTAKGPRTLTARTTSDGRYEIVVPPEAAGRYKVTPSAKGIEFVPDFRTVLARGKDVTANFKAKVKCPRAKAAAITPGSGVYEYRGDQFADGRVLAVNYSCRSKEAVMRVNLAPFKSELERCGFFGYSNYLYSRRMKVDKSGLFSFFPGKNRKDATFVGKFLSATRVQATFEISGGCDVGATTKDLFLVDRDPLTF